jgi:hypothetical protein
MGFEDFSFDGGQRTFDRFDLIEDVDTVFFLFDHFCYSSNLAFYSADTGQLLMMTRMTHSYKNLGTT